MATPISRTLRVAANNVRPDPDFVARLEARLEREATDLINGRLVGGNAPRFRPLLILWVWFTGWPVSWSPRTRAMVAFATVCIVFAGIAMLSPTVRADTLQQLRKVAGLAYVETERMPQQRPCKVEPCQTIFRPISADEARQVPFALPLWVPEGFVLDGFSSEASPSPNGLMGFRWRNAAGQAIYLYTMPREMLEAQGRAVAIAPAGAQEVVINGEPGMLIGGMWNGQSREWDQSSTHLRANWLRGERFYGIDLHTDGCDADSEACRQGGSPRARLTVADLIRMAESIR